MLCKKIFFTLSVLSLFFFASVAHADNRKKIFASPYQEAEFKKLDKHSVWLSLLAYRPKRLKLYKIESDISNRNFFLSPQGSVDPLAEMNASLRMLLNKKKVKNPDHSFQCRFPARFMFLQQNLKTLRSIKKIHCPDYEKRLKKDGLNGVSLIYASGYLKNPSSYYGHLFLKFDAGGEKRTGDLLDKALNYGAVYPQDENPIVYIVKGIFGGYTGRFSDLDFFFHNFNYAENELRDLWLYDLNLKKSEIAFLNAHAWELLSARFDYYFFQENCAYHMARLVNAMTGASLLPEYKEWVVPIDVFKKLNAAQTSGRNFVKNIRFIPSSQTVFRESFKNLQAAEQKIFRAFVENPQAEKAKAIIAEQPSGVEIIDALTDYYVFLDHADAENRRKNATTKNALLLARIYAPPQTEAKPEIQRADPHTGRNTSMLSLSYVRNSRKKNGAGFRFRPAYYDFLTLSPGTSPYSELSMFDTELYFENDRLRLKQADFIKITNLNLSETGLPGDGGNAWTVAAGIKDKNLSCNSCSRFYAEGGYGKAYAVNQSVVLYGMLKGQMHGEPNKPKNFNAGPFVGALLSPIDGVKISSGAGVKQDFSFSGRATPYFSLESGFGSFTDRDIRISYRYDRASEIKIGFSYYY